MDDTVSLKSVVVISEEKQKTIKRLSQSRDWRFQLLSVYLLICRYLFAACVK